MTWIRQVDLKRGGVVLALAAALCALLPEHGRTEGATQGGVALYRYRVVNSYPHDSRAFTQGLIYRDGFLFESTGQYGQSSLRKVKLETGEVVQQRTVESRYFAEGLTDWGNRLIQLTWQTNVGLVYDLSTFALSRTFAYPGEGWGLTHDGSRLILSDGQAAGELRFLSPTTFKETGRVTVRDDSGPVARLNELEFVRGEVFANVWLTDRIARIDPATGRVTGWIDLAGLLPPSMRSGHDAVLNGIAYDAAGDRLFVTGKYWPRLFEIKLERQQR